MSLSAFLTGGLVVGLLWLGRELHRALLAHVAAAAGPELPDTAQLAVRAAAQTRKGRIALRIGSQAPLALWSVGDDDGHTVTESQGPGLEHTAYDPGSTVGHSMLSFLDYDPVAITPAVECISAVKHGSPEECSVTTQTAPNGQRIDWVSWYGPVLDHRGERTGEVLAVSMAVPGGLDRARRYVEPPQRTSSSAAKAC